MERETGFEPATLNLEGWCSSQLSYSRPYQQVQAKYSKVSRNIIPNYSDKIKKVKKLLRYAKSYPFRIETTKSNFKKLNPVK